MKDDQFERRLLELVSNASERDKKALFAMLTAIEAKKPIQLKKEPVPVLKLVKSDRAA